MGTTTHDAVVFHAKEKVPEHNEDMRNLSINLLAFLLAMTSSLPFASLAQAQPVIFRMSQLEAAKKKAMEENKPIAWIGTATKYLAPSKNILGKGSHAATQYAIRALQRETILIYSDCETENHQEPSVVDQALHSPDAHYNVPGVIILTPSMDKVIAKTFYKADEKERGREFLDVLRKLRDKTAWQEKKPSSDPKK